MKRGRPFPLRVEINGVTAPVERVRSGNGYTGLVLANRETGVRQLLSLGAADDAIRAAKVAAGRKWRANFPHREHSAARVQCLPQLQRW